MNYKVLVVDDEEEIVDLLELYLEKEGFQVNKAYNGIEAWDLIKNIEINIAIIDIMMPGIDGFRLVKYIRQEYNIPVIMLSAKSDDYNKILGLELGADDYITKPFNPLEVIARVNAQLRRSYSLNTLQDKPQENTQLVVDDLKLDISSCTLKIKDKKVPLTSIEYKILKLLMERPNRIFTKKQIYENVWEEYFSEDDNTIMVHISNLRDKIEQNSKRPIHLITIRGLGYKIQNNNNGLNKEGTKDEREK